MTLQQTHNRNLASLSRSKVFALAHMHVPSLAANEGLVNFNLSAKFGEGSGLHGLADSMKQIPRALLSDYNTTVNFIRTNAVLRVDDQPDGSQPLVQTDRAIFHDGSDLDAEVLLALQADPCAASLNKRMSVRLATRANDSVRPADSNHAAQRSFCIGEVFDSLNKCFWEGVVHGGSIVRKKRDMSQVYYRPFNGLEWAGGMTILRKPLKRFQGVGTRLDTGLKPRCD